MSRSIDPRRLYRLEDSSSVNRVPRVITLEELKQAREQVRDAKRPTFENAQAASQRECGNDSPQDGSASRHLRRFHKRWKSQKKNVENYASNLNA